MVSLLNNYKTLPLYQYSNCISISEIHKLCSHLYFHRFLWRTYWSAAEYRFLYFSVNMEQGNQRVSQPIGYESLAREKRPKCVMPHRNLLQNSKCRSLIWTVFVKEIRRVIEWLREIKIADQHCSKFLPIQHKKKFLDPV